MAIREKLAGTLAATAVGLFVILHLFALTRAPVPVEPLPTVMKAPPAIDDGSASSSKPTLAAIDIALPYGIRTWGSSTRMNVER